MRDMPRDWSEKMADNGYYLYGVIKNVSIGENIPGVDQRGKVFIAPFDGIAGVISSVGMDEFSEVSLKKNLESLDWVRERVFSHERVVEEIMKQTAVIPMKFCTIFTGIERVFELLKNRYEFFLDLLEAYSGKCEWGIKVYRNNQNVGTRPSSSGMEYLKNKKAEYDRLEADEKRINAFLENILKRIKAAAQDTRINRLTPEELLNYEGKPTKEQVLNISILIEKDETEKLKKVIDEIADEYRETLMLEAAGPLPVYSFIADKNKEISDGSN